jgi:hypothetical protein
VTAQILMLRMALNKMSGEILELGMKLKRFQNLVLDI